MSGKCEILFEAEDSDGMQLTINNDYGWKDPLCNGIFLTINGECFRPTNESAKKLAVALGEIDFEKEKQK